MRILDQLTPRHRTRRLFQRQVSEQVSLHLEHTAGVSLRATECPVSTEADAALDRLDLVDLDSAIEQGRSGSHVQSLPEHRDILCPPGILCFRGPFFCAHRNDSGKRRSHPVEDGPCFSPNRPAPG